MSLIRKKICMLGAFAVGKTSLVRQFVESIFSEKYLTTVGVKVDRKDITIADRDIQLLIWDIQGEDKNESLRKTYFRGMAGYLLVIDGTRPETVEVALDLTREVGDMMGPLPFVVLLNKYDLRAQWQIEPAVVARLGQQGRPVIHTSAKTGEGVEEAFEALAIDIVGQDVL